MPPKKIIRGHEGADSSLESLRGKIEFILRNGYIDERESFEDLYRESYRIVLAGRAKKYHDMMTEVIYKELISRFESLIKRALGVLIPAWATKKETLTSFGSGTEIEFFTALEDFGKESTFIFSVISEITEYLDMAYRRDKRLPYTFPIGCNIFRKIYQEQVFVIDATESTLQDLTLNWIMREIERNRNQEMANIQLLRLTVQFLKSISEGAPSSHETPYSICEDIFLRNSEKFYQEEANAWLKHWRQDAYFQQACRRIEDDWNWCLPIFGKISTNKISNIMENQFISQQKEQLLGLGASVDAIKWLQNEGEIIRSRALTSQPEIPEATWSFSRKLYR
ncbi:Cullin repeat-containing protein [Corynespora cassiicola Philippines]|uniref:Cullin repeat-containing protein n=1 Tax=Corynespora cassiicola Philippines TaxID=1448308 RepID=A0A2T2N765_CORCC|nr:Cullin repeat-containing protein [Corynespora cassiicola Philippines]